MPNTEPIPEATLSEWRRIEQAATAGPWEGMAHSQGNPSERQAWSIWLRSKAGQHIAWATLPPPNAPADATFIATARTALPALLDEVERLGILADALSDVWDAALAVYTSPDDADYNARMVGLGDALEIARLVKLAQPTPEPHP